MRTEAITDVSTELKQLCWSVKAIIDGYFSDRQIGMLGPVTVKGTKYETFVWGIKVEEGQNVGGWARQPAAVIYQVMQWIKTQDSSKGVHWRIPPEILNDEDSGLWKIRWRLAVE